MAVLTWLRAPGGALGIEEGVVRARDVQCLQETQSLLALAQRQADEVTQAAHVQAEVLLAQAREQAAGALQQAHTEAAELKQRAYDDAVAQAVRDWHERQAGAAVDKQRSLREMHEKLAQIVTSAVERIVHSHDRTALYQRALKNVQSLTRGATSLKLRVGAQDHAHASDCIASVAALGDAGLSVEVVCDPALRPGSCIFESESGVLDASLHVQLDSLRGAMEKAVRRAVLADEAEAAAR